MMMKKAVSTCLLAMMAVVTMAQMMNPIHFTSQLKELKGGEGEIVFSATIDPGWHVYSTNLGDDGPISASFNAVKMDGVQTVGSLQPRGKEIKEFDTEAAAISYINTKAGVTAASGTST